MINFNYYDNNQVILTSDRLIFNSKKDDIFILSNKTIGLSSNDSVHINIGDKNNITDKNKFVLNSPKIYLGIYDQEKSEPVCKADKTIEIFNSMIDNINIFLNSLSLAKGEGSGIVLLTSINLASKDLKQKLDYLKKELDHIKSEVTYTL